MNLVINASRFLSAFLKALRASLRSWGAVQKIAGNIMQCLVLTVLNTKFPLEPIEVSHPTRFPGPNQRPSHRTSGDDKSSGMYQSDLATNIGGGMSAYI